MVSTFILGISVIGRGPESLGDYLDTSVTRSPTEAAPHRSDNPNLLYLFMFQCSISAQMIKLQTHESLQNSFIIS